MHLEFSTFKFHLPELIGESLEVALVGTDMEENTNTSTTVSDDLDSALTDGNKTPQNFLQEEHYCAHFSNDAKQHASTSKYNMKKELDFMWKNKIICKGHTTMDHTDGCVSQYRSATAIFFMTVLSATFGVVIDRMIHAPSHGKGKVDGLAAVAKKFLLQCMRIANSDAVNKPVSKFRFRP